MSKTLKAGDPVFNGDDLQTTYYVTDVDYDAKTADIKTTAGAVRVENNVAWSDLTLLTDSENTARIERESKRD